MSDISPLPERVTFITQEFYPKIGGAATVVAELAKATSALGKRVEVLAPGTPEESDTQEPFRVQRTGTRGKQDWLDRLSLLRFLKTREVEPGEELVFAEPGAVRAALYARFLGIQFHSPPVLILHGTEILRFTAWPHRRILFRRLINQCRCVHVLSLFNKELLHSRLTGIRTPIIVAPGAPSVKATEGPHKTREKEGTPEDPIVILTVGRLHPRKGQLETLEALSRLPINEQKRIHYRIVGPNIRSQYREKILTLASTCCFKTELTGPLPDAELEEEYQSADIFALTSRQDRLSVEGFGLVYLDASSRGLPIVATRSGGIPEAVLEGRTGLLAGEAETDEISKCFETLIRDPDLRRKLGNGGRKFASTLSWAKTASLLFPLTVNQKKT